MALDTPPQNKMMQAAPAKKQFFFSPTSEHYAELVYADTIEEAERLYHKMKRLIFPLLSTTPETSKGQQEGVQ